MKCKHCGSEWKTNESVSSSLSACPFCGKSLVDEEDSKFYENSQDALAAIMRQFGPDILLGKLNAHFSDLAPSVPQNIKKLVYAVYENGAANALKDNMNGSQTGKEGAVKLAIRRLTDAFIAEEAAENIVYEFVAALGWQVAKPEPPPAKKAVVKKPAVRKVGTKVARNPKPASKAVKIIKFGKYYWKVLDVQGDRALIITKDAIEQRAYHKIYVDITWKNCTLRSYLNGAFYNTFGAEDKKRIIKTTIHNPDNLWYGIKGGKDTQDKIFLLSLEEVDKYFGDSGDYLNKRRENDWCFSNSHDEDRAALYNNKACWWWLRSPGNYVFNAAFVNDDGYVLVYGYRVYSNYGGVRPALWLHL